MRVARFILKMETGLPARCMEQEVGVGWLETIKDAARSEDHILLINTLHRHRRKQASADPEDITFKVNRMMCVFYEMRLEELVQKHEDIVCLIKATLPEPE